MHSVVSLLAAVLLAGCAFDDGKPWGRFTLELSAAFAPSPERLTSEGRLKTDRDYAVEITSLSVRFAEVRVELSPGTGALGAFDPASPPPGFSLCHGGHCHADDGRLVPYDEVAVEMREAGGSGAIFVVRSGPEDPFVLAEAPTEVPLAACLEGCAVLEPSRASTAAVQLAALTIEAQVFDRRTGDARRLPEAGVSFVGTIPVTEPIVRPLDAAFGPGEALEARVRFALALPEGLFDGVDFSAALAPGAPAVDLDASPALRQAIVATITDHSALTLSVERHDP